MTWGFTFERSTEVAKAAQVQYMGMVGARAICGKTVFERVVPETS
jgi:hypothetical protein